MPRRSTEKITQSLARKLSPRSDSDFTIYDSELPGFGIRVRQSGSVTFVLKYRNRENRQRFLTLGTYGPITVHEARQKAIKALASVANDTDPVEEKRAERSAKTIGELCDQYLRDSELGKDTISPTNAVNEFAAK